jgi:probable rRNA maturation factor
MMDDPQPRGFSEEASIQFHFEEVRFELPHPERLQEWIRKIIARERCRLSSLNFIFCRDSYLHQINARYLDHDSLTDIITFPYQEPPMVEGDVFISIDRVRENAESYDAAFHEELLRVISHGILHLCGYRDKTKEEKARMTEKEDEALRLWQES